MSIMPSGYQLISRELINKKGKTYWKYFVLYENNIVGSVKVKYKKSKLTLLNLNVLPEHRGKNLATDLLLFVIDKHNSENIYIKPNPYLDKPVSKEKLKMFYQKFKFIEIGIEGEMIRPSSLEAH